MMTGPDSKLLEQLLQLDPEAINNELKARFEYGELWKELKRRNASGTPFDETIFAPFNPIMLPFPERVLERSSGLQGLLYGPDDRKEIVNACENDMGINVSKLAKGVAAKISEDNIEVNDGNTLDIKDTAVMRLIDRHLDDDGQPMLSYDQPFLTQPTCTNGTVFLVAEDIVLTAGHIATQIGLGNEKNVAFIFNYQYNRFLNIKTKGIHPDDVYKGKEILTPWKDDVSEGDWALIRLERPVEGDKSILELSSRRLEKEEKLLSIGSPLGLPLKYIDNARVENIDDNSPFFESSLDNFKGSSGSPVFDEDNKVVGITVSTSGRFKLRTDQCSGFVPQISDPNADLQMKCQKITDEIIEILSKQ